jgi:prevent-host-death family protein
MKEISISKFMARCLAVMKEVRLSGEPVLVTKRGKPIAEIVPPARPVTGERLGNMVGTARIVGDIVSPVFDEKDIEAAQS